MPLDVALLAATTRGSVTSFLSARHPVVRPAPRFSAFQVRARTRSKRTRSGSPTTEIHGAQTTAPHPADRRRSVALPEPLPAARGARLAKPSSAAGCRRWLRAGARAAAPRPRGPPAASPTRGPPPRLPRALPLHGRGQGKAAPAGPSAAADGGGAAPGGGRRGRPLSGGGGAMPGGPARRGAPAGP